GIRSRSTPTRSRRTRRARSTSATEAAHPVTRTLAAAALALLIAAPVSGAAQPSLAQCLTDKGFVMYGASWCPYCREQKRQFGRDAKNLPYVECSADDAPHGKGTQVCEKRGIDVYP